MWPFSIEVRFVFILLFLKCKHDVQHGHTFVLIHIFHHRTYLVFKLFLFKKRLIYIFIPILITNSETVYSLL